MDLGVCCVSVAIVWLSGRKEVKLAILKIYSISMHFSYAFLFIWIILVWLSTSGISFNLRKKVNSNIFISFFCTHFSISISLSFKKYSFLPFYILSLTLMLFQFHSHWLHIFVLLLNNRTFALVNCFYLMWVSHSKSDGIFTIIIVHGYLCVLILLHKDLAFIIANRLNSCFQYPAGCFFVLLNS